MTDIVDAQYDESVDEMPTLYDNSPYYNMDEATELLINKKNTFSILSLNCQSLSAKFDQLRIYVEHFEELRCPFSVICLQETWFTELQDVSLFQIQGYVLIHTPRTCSAHGGVAIYLRESFEYNILPINGDPRIWDGLFIEVNLSGNFADSNASKLIVGNIYRPPREIVEDYDMFFSEIDEILSSKFNRYKEVVITGDFNLDLLKLRDSIHINNFFETMISNGYLPKITLPTRITAHSSTLIDNCFVKLSSEFSKTTSGILNYNLSDHQPYFVTLDYLLMSNETSKFIKVYRNTPEARDNFKNEILQNFNSSKFHTKENTDPNINYDIFSNIINSALNKHFPIKIVHFNKYKHKRSKWITTGIMRSIKFRDKLYAKLRSTPTISPDYNKYKINLQTYNRILRQNIRLAKKTYYQSCFDKFRNDIKGTWKTIKEIINRSHKVNNTPKYFLINDLPESNPTRIANEFNKYFTEIGPNLADTISFPPNKSFKDYLNNTADNDFKFKKLSEKEIIEIIDSLKPKSSYGTDGISNKLLKFIKYEIAKPLTLIINQSFQTGIFPNQLKIAKVIPLFKKNENFILGNYRPVSVLSSLSKVIEKAMHIQLYNHFTKYNLFYDNQYGFRKNHSTEYAVLELVNRIVEKMDKNEVPINIYLDLSKAFDTLDHDILLFKLAYYGVSGSSLILLKNYLSNRKQYVEFCDVQSEFRTIYTGVPQGSILGPLLFIIYLNDLIMATELFKPIIYADDTALCATLNAFANINQNLEDKINSELVIINDWFRLNKLSLNVNKTKAMLFYNPRRRLDNINIKINDDKIEFVDQFNYLGIILDSHLSWRPHMHAVRQKISKTVGIMSKLKNVISPGTLLTIYNSLILPHLNYGILAWGIRCDKLFKIQKKSVRLILNAKYNAHTSPLFKQLQLLKVSDLCALQELKFAFKFQNGLLPYYFNSIQYFRHLDRHNYETRNKSNIEVLPSRHAFVSNSICYRLPEILNSCPICIKEKIQTHSIAGFTKYIKNYFLEKYSLNCSVINCYICQNSV